MDEHAKIPADAHRQAVRPRRHGHRDPRDATAAPAAASSTRCWPSRSCRASIRRSACWWTSRTRSSSTPLLRWGNDDIKQRLPAEARGDDRRRLRAVGGRLGQRRLRAHDARARGRATASSSPAASSGSPTATKPTSSSSSRRSIPRRATAASRRSSSSAACPGSRSARRKTSSASAPAARASSSSRTAACRRPTCSARSARATRSAIETLNEGRIGIGAQMLGLAQGALEHAIELHEGAQAVRQGRSPSSRPCSTSSRARRSTSRRRG